MTAEANTRTDADMLGPDMPRTLHDALYTCCSNRQGIFIHVTVPRVEPILFNAHRVKQGIDLGE